MALPKINETPGYEMVIPSTGKKVKYRPFLVKEQKILMIASESQDKKQILSSMLDTLTSCIADKINLNSLATFDVDYMFTQIRAKSVGEKTTLVNKCEKCEEKTEFTLNLDDIKPPKVKQNIKIKLTDSISVLMKYPSYNAFINNDKILADDNQTETLMEFIIECMDSILTEEEQIRLKDESKEEIQTFVDSLTSEQFKLMAAFINDLPKLTHTFTVNCSKCTHTNIKTLEGIEDFF